MCETRVLARHGHFGSPSTCSLQMARAARQHPRRRRAAQHADCSTLTKDGVVNRFGNGAQGSRAGSDGTHSMHEDWRAPMDSPAPHDTSTYNLQPYPTSPTPHLPSILPLLPLPHTPPAQHAVNPAQCLAHRTPHHVTVHHNTCNIVHTTRSCLTCFL